MTALPPHIEDAIEAFKSHQAVIEIIEVKALEDGAFRIEAKFDTNLPSRWSRIGESPDGVRSSEVVEAFFPAEYPNRAPRFTLRADFNSNLPHINFHHQGR